MLEIYQRVSEKLNDADMNFPEMVNLNRISGNI